MNGITLQNPEKSGTAWPDAVAIRLARSSVRSGRSTAWLAPFPANSSHLAAPPVRLTGRLRLPTAWLAALTGWLTHFTVWLVNSAAWLAGSTAPINHLTARIIRSAMRFSMENTLKTPKIVFSAWVARQSRQLLGLRQPYGALTTVNSGRGLPHSKTLRTHSQLFRFRLWLRRDEQPFIASKRSEDGSTHKLSTTLTLNQPL
jgi:hypothetical protein